MVESKQRNRAQLLDREMIAWDWSCKGKSERWIALEMGLSHSGVGKIIDRVEARLEKRFLRRVARRKITQDGQLSHIVMEALDAWDHSKLPRKKAASRTVEGGEGAGTDEVTTSEIVERDGDPAHLYVAMTALRDLRSLHGLDVAPALQEASASVAELVRSMVELGSQHEQETAADQPGGSPESVQADQGGAIPVQDGSGPIQPDDPVSRAPLESAT